VEEAEGWMAGGIIRGQEELAVDFEAVGGGEGDLLGGYEFCAGEVVGDGVGGEVVEFAIGDDCGADGELSVGAEDGD